MLIRDRLLLVSNTSVISYDKGKLYKRTNLADKQCFLCELPNAGIKRFLVRIPLLERLFRLEPRFAFPYKDNTFYLSFGGAMYLVDADTGKIKLVHSYREKMHNPLNPCVVDNLEGFESGFYYGEYWGNSNHDEVSIFRGNGESWEKRYTFPRGSILHIHSIIPDYENERLLILTGDSDHESAIWEARKNFTVVERIIGGSQQFRSCSAFVNNSNILFTTDTPKETNYLYKFFPGDKHVEKIHKLAGPCIYSSEVKDSTGKKYYIFATSVEPDSAFAGTWKYRFSTKIAPGVEDSYSHVYLSDGIHVKEVAKFKKDGFPFQLFQFGNIRFPYQGDDVNDTVFLCPQSVKGLHGKTISISLPELLRVKEL